VIRLASQPAEAPTMIQRTTVAPGFMAAVWSTFRATRGKNSVRDLFAALPESGAA
jgi:hypothetical protein